MGGDRVEGAVGTRVFAQKGLGLRGLEFRDWAILTVDEHNCSAVMRSSSKEGSYVRLVDFCITQL